MKKRKLRKAILLVAAFTVAVTSMAQQAPAGESRQQLVVTIVVDQLRTDYVEMLRNRFGKEGFNRLIDRGAYIENLHFDIVQPDIANTTAMLFTGAFPGVNGIAGEKIYRFATRQPDYSLSDPGKIGNFTNETFSPAALQVSTLADELRAATQYGMVHSIATDAQQAIIMAGHAANSAFWISDIDGKWATTTYYKEVPKPVADSNYKQPLATRLDTMVWHPSLRPEQYCDIATHKQYTRFGHTFAKNDRDRFVRFKHSPLANEEVTRMAMEYITALRLGKRGTTDMLCIGLTAAPYDFSGDGCNTIELQDTYLKLDAQIARLLQSIDTAVGLQNTLVVLASTGYYTDNSPYDERLCIPSGEFYPSRAISLLNMYLMAMHGNGEWVSGYYNGSFYLNRDLIKSKGLDLSAVRAKSSEFLRQMSGVSAAYHYEEILNNPSGAEAHRLHRCMVPSVAGDVTIEVAAGWRIVENERTKHKQVRMVRYNAISTPAFIMARGVVPRRISAPVEATTLAPSVSSILRVRSPNAAREMPLSLH
ncbi:MAG: alkaline phosphatase family protein [Bacteroidales bacterium]|nr:alkaline phosphatase family protein [Bacteroidales bacterium]